MSFAELNVWTFIMVFAVLLASMLVAAALKRFIPALNKTLVPVSVLGGILLLIISTIVYFAAGDYLFNLPVFGSPAESDADKSISGMQMLELITYHCLGIGFIASGMRNTKKKFNKKRAGEIFDSGIVTVNGYLIQAFGGLIITIIAAWALHTNGLISAAGILLAFGFGQGTGQALNYGKIYENDYGFAGGSNFGLTVAALGFLVACIGGVIYINVMKKRGMIKIDTTKKRSTLADYEDENEIPAVSSMDKMTVQFAIVLVVYAISFGIMYGLSALLPSLADTLFGFNFLIGVILTIPAKAILNKLYDKGIVKKRIINNYMMDRISGLAFDIMIVAGVAAIQLPLLAEYWAVLLIMAVYGTIVTFVYVNFVSKKLFGAYRHEQFLAFFGMLTGTASTGMILLREIDGSYRTPASENLVYQSLPAIVFGFPLMFLAPYAATSDLAALITCIVVGACFVVLNLLLFRRTIFKKTYARYLSRHGDAEDEDPSPSAGGAGDEADGAEPTDSMQE
ncbi:MAG TPA: hypothetical protein IAB42_03660 [Candidatus Coproplasma avistercoris]|nr:hypothetical protein [Candidatus Coproplasma avistercoris]